MDLSSLLPSDWPTGLGLLPPRETVTAALVSATATLAQTQPSGWTLVISVGLSRVSWPPNPPRNMNGSVSSKSL